MMASAQSDYYAAMVMAASAYSEHSHPSVHAEYPMQHHPYTLPSTVAHAHSQSMNSSTASRASNTSVPSVPVKRYTHNPYASEPSTPTSASHNTSTSSLNNSVEGGSSSFSPVYAPEGSYEFSTYPVVNNLTEQFFAVVGTIVPTACTPRGRHLLLSVLRLQHLDKIQMIFEEVVPQVNALSMDTQGCHVVRTLIEFISGEQLATLVSYLDEQSIVSMAMCSQHTRRTLQTMFERHKSPCLDRVVQVIASDACRLAMTQQGCIAIMRIVENALPNQKHYLIQALLPSFPTLTMDPYGNYVVQCVLQNVDATSTAAVVCESFAGHWLPLSCNKFASNVMEKVVRLVNGTARANLVRELVFDNNNLLCLMQDGFGNFVLQAIIDSTQDQAEYRSIADVVRPLLHTSPYGHKIDAKLKSKRYGGQHPNRMSGSFERSLSGSSYE